MMKKFSLLFFWCKSFILFELFSSERNQLGFECKERAENMCCVWFQRKFLTITFPFICSHRVLWVNLVLDYYFMYMYDRRQLQNKELNERARNEIVYEKNLIWFFLPRNHKAMGKEEKFKHREWVGSGRQTKVRRRVLIKSVNGKTR